MKIWLWCIYFLGTSFAWAAESKQFVYNENGKRDPFWPLVSASGTITTYESDMTAADMVLEGVVVDAHGDNLAIVNGKIVKKGEQVASYQVDSISNDHVDLSNSQEHLTIRLKKGGM